MTLSKQFWEPGKWMTHPQQSALNKASIAFKLPMGLLTGKQYQAGPGSYAPPIESYSGYVGKQLLPIWGNQMIDKGPAQGLSSMVGFPIQGTPNDAGGGGRTPSPRGGGRTSLAR